jgi:hypothetical protein
MYIVLAEKSGVDCKYQESQLVTFRLEQHKVNLF